MLEEMKTRAGRTRQRRTSDWRTSVQLSATGQSRFAILDSELCERRIRSHRFKRTDHLKRKSLADRQLTALQKALQFSFRPLPLFDCDTSRQFDLVQIPSHKTPQ